jgi:hypothetical protein
MRPAYLFGAARLRNASIARPPRPDIPEPIRKAKTCRSILFKDHSMTAFSHVLSGATHIVAGAGTMQMVMLVRNRKEYFTDFIEREAKAKDLKVIVNGSYIDLSFGSSVAVVMRNSALEASDSIPKGQVIQEGKLLAGVASTGKFNFSQDTCGGGKFSAGLGNPPSSSCSAIGGIAPIVIGKMPYGAENVYRPGVPDGAPSTGDVAPEFMPYLVQKSNAMFSTLLSRGRLVGKTAVGFSSSAQSLVVLCQADGDAGLDANGIRTVFIANAVDNAVFFDCSDSATLYYDKKFLVKPGANKNEFLTVAVGFK